MDNSVHSAVEISEAGTNKSSTILRQSHQSESETIVVRGIGPSKNPLITSNSDDIGIYSTQNQTEINQRERRRHKKVVPAASPLSPSSKSTALSIRLAVKRDEVEREERGKKARSFDRYEAEL